jgi:DNA-binding FadR family transcriptional regulator
MNPAPIFDRVYADLRHRLRTGIWRPGQHIDLLRLASDLDASTTPVRDALNRLVGERLLATGLNEGFAMAQMTEPDLRDLYDWNRQLLLLAVSYGGTAPASSVSPQLDIAASTALLFAELGARANNPEHRATIDNMSARLHVVRLVEARLLEGSEVELATIRDAMHAHQTRALRHHINIYHRRRGRIAGQLVHMLYRAEFGAEF